MRLRMGGLVVAVCFCLAISVAGQAQAPAAPDSPTIGGAAAANPQAAVPRLMKFSGVVLDAAGKPVTGALDVTFTLYARKPAAIRCGLKLRSVEADEQGRYTALIGAMHAEGLAHGSVHLGRSALAGRASGPRGGTEAARAAVERALRPEGRRCRDPGRQAGFGLHAVAFGQWHGRLGRAVRLRNQRPDRARAARISEISKKGSASRKSPCSALTSDGTAAANSIALFTTSCNVENSAISQSSGNVGIGATAP